MSCKDPDYKLIHSCSIINHLFFLEVNLKVIGSIFKNSLLVFFFFLGEAVYSIFSSTKMSSPFSPPRHEGFWTKYSHIYASAAFSIYSMLAFNPPIIIKHLYAFLFSLKVPLPYLLLCSQIWKVRKTGTQ